jgi:hypothetical protein
LQIQNLRFPSSKASAPSDVVVRIEKTIARLTSDGESEEEEAEPVVVIKRPARAETLKVSEC